jgi:hypothetical protein
MPKRYPKKAREVSVALYQERLSVPEITRRLNEGTAGLLDKEGKPQPIPITERRVAEYVAEHKAQHGPRPEPEDAELTADSINRVKQRALNVLAREIAHLEGLPTGRISAKQSTALRQHYATLDDMERRQELAEKRKGRGKRRAGKAEPAGEKRESAIEALAKAEQGTGQQAGRQEGHSEAGEAAQSPIQSQEQADTKTDKRREEFDRMVNIPFERGLSQEEIDEIMGSARA